jgi:NAD(P)-dependent dehydrogenase (short-subunit alcohol dehydrogenase family)
MSRVSVITGGAGGMGLATAKVVGRDHTVVLCDVRRDRLETAAATLKNLGIEPTVVNCDVTDQLAVAGLFETASGLGTIAAVIHTAGVSPSMGGADYVMRTNALGTVNVNEVFYRSAGEGSSIVNVASMAAHILPEDMIPTSQFPLALQDDDAFMNDMMTTCNVVPQEARSGIAYAVSKSFVRWYCTSQAERFNGRGLRIVSVSPGSIDTEMGRLEEQAGAGARSPTPRSRGGASRKRWQSYSPSASVTKPGTSPARIS